MKIKNIKNINILKKQIEDFQKIFEKFLKKLNDFNKIDFKNNYISNHKEQELLAFWKDFLYFSKDFKNFIDSIKYKSFLVITNYDNFIIKRYLILMYINFLIDIKKTFVNNNNIFINFLQKKWKKEYRDLVKNIYKYEYIKIINTNEYFIKNIKSKVNKKFHYMLNSEEILSKEDEKYFFSEANIFFYLFHLKTQSVKIDKYL